MALDRSLERLIGRERERAEIDAFLSREAPTPRTLAIVGEPGIGKTELWRAAVSAERERSTVLECRGVEGESLLPYAGLVDLLGDVAADVLPALPEVQRRALGAALVLEDPGHEPRDQLAISLATLGALRTLASAQRVLVAIDDAHWLDPPSTRVLEYAFRRLRSEPILIVATVRVGVARPDLSAGEVEEIVAAPLSVEALGTLLRTRLDLAIARPALIELHAACGGNPLYALEIARHAVRRGEPIGAGGQIQLPPSLSALIGDRLGALSAGAGELALAAAVLAQPSADALDAAGFDRSLFVESSVADVLELDGDRVRFTHPLLATAARSGAPAAALRRIHAKLANVLGDEVERAGHLAEATVRPDDEVANILERAAQVAAARGAPYVAARLARRALALTPEQSVETAIRLTSATAEYELSSGDAAASANRLRSLLELLPAGGLRADTLRRLAHLEDDIGVARSLAEQAVDEAGDDASLLVRLHALLVVLCMAGGDTENARLHGAAAARFADGADDVTRATGLVAFARVESMVDGRLRRDMFETALEIHRRRPPSNAYDDTRFWFAVSLASHGELDLARSLLVELLELAGERGDESTKAGVASWLARWEIFAGNLARASELAERAVGSSASGGEGNVLRLALIARGLCSAMVGNLFGAREDAETVLATASAGDALFGRDAHAILGLAALTDGDVDSATTYLSRAVEQLDAQPDVLLGTFSMWNLIEALVRGGNIDAAEEMCERLEDRERRRSRPVLVPPMIRCRALVQLARREVDNALVTVDAAIAADALPSLPFEHARTLVVRGNVLRRAKRKGQADEAFAAAATLFDQIGARRWAERTAEERQRLGLRPTSADLTPMERKVAETLAGGATTKEAAAALFLSPKTVEFHLHNAYMKLGVRSRAALARAMTPTGRTS